MGALAKDSTLHSMLESMTGYIPERTASVEEITFTGSQFETGGIDNSTGQNKNESGYYRTKGYIDIPANKWKIQLYAEKPFLVSIYYYNENKEFQGRDLIKTGYSNISDYPYCRIKVYLMTDYIDDIAEFLENCLKIQYIANAPAENEYFLHNHLFNGNFEFDRNGDGVADGWELRNSPTSSSMSNNTQFVTPSVQGIFIRMESDNRLNGHQIYVALSTYSPHGDCGLGVYNQGISCSQNTKYTRYSKIITAVNSDVNPGINCQSSAVAHEIGIRNVMMIDLTDVYGVGNEPTLTQVEEIIDKYYGGYVPCNYVVKYNDADLPVDILTRLKNIDMSSDKLTVTNGAVTSVGHYVGDELKTTITINRDNFGNLVSVEEV